MRLLFESDKSIIMNSKSKSLISPTIKTESPELSSNKSKSLISPKIESKSSELSSNKSKSLILPSIESKSSSTELSSIEIKSSSHIEPIHFSEDKIMILTTEIIEKLLSKKIKIGNGATSTVYKVMNCFTNNEFFAIKILNDIVFKFDDEKKSKKTESESFWEDDDEIFGEEEDFQIDIEKIKNLFKEYEILTNLKHPNIIKIYGFFYGDKKHAPAILLEYCKCNLEKAIQYLDDIDLVAVIYEICNAMMYIHKMKIIHRDLKTTNILIDKNKHVRICDFGIAKVMNMSSTTSFTHGVGTFLYMAPELFQPDSRCDKKIDVYAFGVVAYFILTKGKYPKNWGPGNLEKVKIPKSINKVSMSLIKNCWYRSPESRPSFRQIIKFIIKNNFLLIDGIEDKISALKEHLKFDEKLLEL